jgi:GTP-binding protein Era
MNPEITFRSGYCAIAGIPNAGKSTLLNALLDTKLSIVSAKPQTTRKRVLGIYSTENEQIIFLDTPGMMKRASTLHHKALIEEVTSSFTDADVILLLAESNRPAAKALPDGWEEAIKKAGDKPIVLGISKTDLLPSRDDILPRIAEYAVMNCFTDIVPFSSRSKYNLAELKRVIISHLPAGQPFYDTDQLSDQNNRFFTAEIIREEVFHLFRDEIPYSTEVIINDFKEREKGKWFISADIIVERDSQKGIIIGARAESLKKLGAAARKKIELFLDAEVYLELHVKVRADWRNDKHRLRDMGYQV